MFDVTMRISVEQATRPVDATTVLAALARLVNDHNGESELLNEGLHLHEITIAESDA